MITRSNFPELLSSLDFSQTNKIYYKTINSYELKVDFANEKLIYPEGLKAQRDTTKNFSAPENFVVFECVHNLLQSGYKPEHIILEQGMPGGHGDTGGFCDIIVQDNDGVEYLLIECKTADNGKSREFSKAWAKMLKNGGQLFNYFNTYRRAKWLCLYCSDFRNDKVESIYHLISMTDNNDFLKNNDKLQSFAQIQAENGAKVDYFNVWTDTYQQDFITHNLFESEIFKVGNRPYNVNDLKIVDNDTIQKKYHQFATIMRQHNVSARENAFDKLVNLFLCKVVDEKANPENLKVYWKGAASDNHYDLQDRLQQLYKIGMKDFLGEEVTYISEEEINNAFHLFKNKKDETKRTVLEYFTQLKFYSNNPFAFLDVHNEKLFFQNAVILKEIVQMLQDIKLKNEEEQHQFLGDLFEGFLDQGVKQSEGQFFTPMPIVKFLISSLPLEQVLQNENAPKVIDYACGAGHFLTEYASQIKLLLTDSGRNLSEFYQKIYGIEKEYRLSKVAKVSAFMYGQDEMNIIYADALAQNQEQGKALQDGSFSLLVANPPYSVKGFLSTLSDEDKAKFTLYENIDNEETFNSIETFFIEKATQLLHAEGIAVIVLPSSILTNGNIYIKCREILLQYFDLVAIAEFGSGTFGKTGTNTATLFLRRKQTTPNLAEHYKNRVEQWQSGNFGFDGLFEDHHLLQSYCNHCSFNLDDYKAFLSAIEEMPSAIAETELFQEYRRAFEKRKFAKSVNLAKEWLAFAKAIEADKLRFFMLAQNNPQDVLVVKMPTDNKEKKAFLGYEWSSAKGSEGIKYLNQTSSDEDDSLSKLKGINQIQTPLFNSQNLFDETKINSLIRQNFNQQAVKIPKTLANYVSLLPLAQMLDFSRVEFDKAIRTNVQKKIKVLSKYPIIALEEFPVEIKKGKSITAKNAIAGDYKVVAGGKDFAYMHNEFNRMENTITISASGANAGFVNFWTEKIFASDCTTVRADNYIGTKFIFTYLQSIQENIFDLARGAAQPHVYPDDIKRLPIPKVPLDIQQKVVEECQKIDDEFNRTRMQIEEYRAKISKIFNDLDIVRGVKRFKINDLGFILMCKRIMKHETNSVSGVPFYKIGTFGGVADSFISLELYEQYKNKYPYPQKGQVLISAAGTLGKVVIFDGKPSYFQDSNIVWIDVNEKIINNTFLYYVLKNINWKKYATEGSVIPRIYNENLRNVEIPVPDFETQKSIIAQVNEYENKIIELENVLANSAKVKKAVLEKWL
ncbi:restriction endonuclease subunit S [Haemophilus influenzae]|nr:restriction endonuclease subunit S [Haemophilus influenzae]PRJ59455.1 putative type I restriction enzymeP M protein [Haemophilus influenzae]PRJ93751.1 putative type I restriction enzymeP M protein [Haemophilus influenzae]PRK62919.1 putative type I restriction enzymeP M protein [Haemophilus influenzae]